MSLLEIDLNVIPTESIDGDRQDVFPSQEHIPDLNLHVYNTLDRNIMPSSPRNEMIDLNEPCEQNDSTMQAEFQEELNNICGKKKNLCNDKRRSIYEMLLKKSVNGKMKKGASIIASVASKFSVSTRSIQHVWKRSKISADPTHKKRDCGRKKAEIDLSRLYDIPLHDRTTLASLACSLNTTAATIHRLFKSGAIRRHSNAIKPILKEENMKSRLQFCISMLDENSLPYDPIFKGMHNIVHIDEKWFYMTKKSEKYYLLPEEEDPMRTCKSKNFIGKIMFLVALARPRFDPQGNVLFDGKIGVFPFVTREPARRNSSNRVAGTLETKPITSVKKEDIRSYLIEKVLPAIKVKWPREDLRNPIFIQQDNARTHIDPHDDKFCRAAQEDGCDIRLICQPPNSPYLNVLDLGFFSAIQALQYRESPKSVEELVHAVHKSFEDFPPVKSNRIFLTLQLCMLEIMKAKGSQKYKIPHINKVMLEREQNLPMQIKCDRTLVEEILNII